MFVTLIFEFIFIYLLYVLFVSKVERNLGSRKDSLKDTILFIYSIDIDTVKIM